MCSKDATVFAKMTQITPLCLRFMPYAGLFFNFQ